MVPALFALSWLVNWLAFHPAPGLDATPEQLGIDAEQIYLTSEDGVRLHAFFLAAPGAQRAILFLHGNAGNASHRLPNAALLAQLGAEVLLLDYRGYGLSEGRPTEAGVYADARAALAYLTAERRVPLEHVFLFGRSIGGAIAVEIAGDRELAGVILESCFTSAADVGRHHFGPLGFLAGDAFASDEKITRMRSPLLFFHGDRDDIIPLALGRRLFDLAPEPKAFETLAGAGHNDTLAVGGRAYLRRIREFLEAHSPPRGA